jgi:hypothetical protein
MSNRVPERDTCPQCGGAEVGFRFIKLADGTKEWTGRCHDCTITWVETPSGPVIEPIRLYPKAHSFGSGGPGSANR